MLKHHNGGSATTTSPRGFGLNGFERAGVSVVEQRTKAKDTIFTPGDPDDRLYFLLSGAVRLYEIYGDYKEATTALLEKEAVFGKLTLIKGRWQNVFSETTADPRLASLKDSLSELAPQLSGRGDV
jgi:CRP-like cAMP-binding protein